MQFQRLFTQSSSDAYDLIHFRRPEAIGERFDIPLAHPENWSLESVEVLADEAATSAIPPDLRPIEENTVPSWLWQQSPARSAGKKETSVGAIFDRVVGAAAYRAWKQRLFANEESARAFYDEARYALAQRFIAIDPRTLGMMGLKWAYGIEIPAAAETARASDAIDIPNAMIDTVVSGKRDRATLNAWHKIIDARAKPVSVALRFSDTEAQWEAPSGVSAGARLNLMGFRHNDGAVNIEALRQAVRMIVVLLDLNDAACGSALAIGYTNLAPLLMALALPYDSEAGRATAAAITAIITAEAYATSAELAGLRGASKAFTANRTASIRALRNHRRAAYGDQNDYEKISVTPAPLALASCPDLALTAAARSAWDSALELAQKHGLRHTQVTSLFASSALALLMESCTEGTAPMRSLLVVGGEGEGTHRLPHPSIIEALARLGYDQKKAEPVIRCIAGALTLEKSPAINHAALRARGLTKAVIEKIEAYLPQAAHLRFAVTPWVLGVDFCKNTLKIPKAKIDDMRFNLLAHLGFSADDIADANAWCYGHEGVGGAGLSAPHAAVFATSKFLPPEAQIRMAAAVQGFVSGETDLELKLPVAVSAERFEKLVLDAWRRGVKSLAVTFDASLKAEKSKLAHRKIAPSAFLHAKAPLLPKRRARSGAARLGGMAHAKPKSRGVSKGH